MNKKLKSCDLIKNDALHSIYSSAASLRGIAHLLLDFESQKKTTIDNPETWFGVGLILERSACDLHRAWETLDKSLNK